MLCVYPPEGNRDQYPNHDEVKYFIEKNDLFLLQRRISKNNLLKFKRDQAFTNLYQAVVELQLLTPAHCGVDKSGGDQDGFSKTLKKPKLTETTATFTTPNIGSNVTVSVQNSQSIARGSTILIQGAGAYSVISVPSTTSITVQNPTGSTGNVPPNTQINAGADIRARLIEIGELGKKIREALKVQELSAAEFALQMIEGAEKVRFCSKP